MAAGLNCRCSKATLTQRVRFSTRSCKPGTFLSPTRRGNVDCVLLVRAARGRRNPARGAPARFLPTDDGERLAARPRFVDLGSGYKLGGAGLDAGFASRLRTDKPHATQQTPSMQVSKDVQKIDFVQQVKPVSWSVRVSGATAEKKPRGFFRLDSRDALFQGGASGPAIVSGHSGDKPVGRLRVWEDPLNWKCRLMAVREKFPALTKTRSCSLRTWIDQRGLAAGGVAHFTKETAASSCSILITGRRSWRAGGDRASARAQQDRPCCCAPRRVMVWGGWFWCGNRVVINPA